MKRAIASVAITSYAWPICGGLFRQEIAVAIWRGVPAACSAAGCSCFGATVAGRLRTGALRFGGAFATGGAGGGGSASLPMSPTTAFLGAAAFAFLGAFAFASSFVAASFLVAPFAAVCLRAPALRPRAFTVAAPVCFLLVGRVRVLLLAAFAFLAAFSFLAAAGFLTETGLAAFVAFLRPAVFLRFVGMGMGARSSCARSSCNSKDSEGRDLPQGRFAPFARPMMAHRYQPRVASASNPNTLKTSGFRSKL